MKGVLDDEDRQSSDATKLYYNFGFASISITDPREHSDKGISQLFKCFALADGRVTATPPLGSTLADLGSAGSSHLRRRPQRRRDHAGQRAATHIQSVPPKTSTPRAFPGPRDATPGKVSRSSSSPPLFPAPHCPRLASRRSRPGGLREDL